MQDGSRKAIAAAFFANLGIAIAKFIAFALTGAASMLAEAIHSVADTSNQALLFLGSTRAQRKATPLHPFGYGRERYFWSFVVAVVLFTLGSAFAIYEGVQKLIDPHEVDSLSIALIVLIVAIVLETFSFRTAIHEANKVRNGGKWWTFIRRSKSPELPVVLLEDLGALVGLILAVIGLLLARVTDNPRWDAAGSLSIGILLGVIAVILLIEMKGLLIGESASDAQQLAIKGTIEQHASVRRLIHLRTQHLGPEELLVAAKVEFGSELTLPELAAGINDLEGRIRSKVQNARVIYIEPDVFGSEPAAPVASQAT